MQMRLLQAQTMKQFRILNESWGNLEEENQAIIKDSDNADKVLPIRAREEAKGAAPYKRQRRDAHESEDSQIVSTHEQEEPSSLVACVAGARLRSASKAEGGNVRWRLH